MPPDNRRAIPLTEGFGVVCGENGLSRTNLLVVSSPLVIVRAVDAGRAFEKSVRVSRAQKCPVDSREILLGRGGPQLLEEAGAPASEFLDDGLVESTRNLEWVPAAREEVRQDLHVGRRDTRQKALESLVTSNIPDEIQTRYENAALDLNHSELPQPHSFS